MPNYRRNLHPGGTFFFTVVTHGRRRWLCSEEARRALREAIGDVRRRFPFDVDGWVLLPDHLHCLWTLPEGDRDFSTRWRLIKGGMTRRAAGWGASADGRLTGVSGATAGGPMTASRRRRHEGVLWQRRFWEHTIRDERDFRTHCDYLHYNPVRHGLVAAPKDWPWSTFHRFVAQGVYEVEWGAAGMSLPEELGGE